MTVLPPAVLIAGIVSMDPSSSACLASQPSSSSQTASVGGRSSPRLSASCWVRASWALGSHTNNYQYANAGRKAVLASGVAALLIGAAPTLVNFLFQTGHGIH